jgi:hypothetical protein
MKISDLANNLQDIGTNIYKIRRYATQLLPPDAEASRQSGKSREIDEKDGFIIYLGIHLVSRMSFTMTEAKAIVTDLKPWMEEKGLFPGMKFNPEPLVKDYEILIMRANTSSGFFYKLRGLIYKKTKTIKGQTVFEERYTEGIITIPPPTGMIFDGAHVSPLRIGLLLKYYLVKIGSAVDLGSFSD